MHQVSIEHFGFSIRTSQFTCYIKSQTLMPYLSDSIYKGMLWHDSAFAFSGRFNTL